MTFLHNWALFLIALSYPPPPLIIDDSSWKNVVENFTVALNPNPRGLYQKVQWRQMVAVKNNFSSNAQHNFAKAKPKGTKVISKCKNDII